jgi:hypothetical protein
MLSVKVKQLALWAKLVLLGLFVVALYQLVEISEGRTLVSEGRTLVMISSVPMLIIIC